MPLPRAGTLDTDVGARGSVKVEKDELGYGGPGTKGDSS